ncbi:hypothetical protein BKA82DRAFT_393650 [Pisolithus tinctorius]|uniref:Uncharacterized protein n=1 Tax=Pisolithus tinctorius Marx 270 TaxID=870435 RepID=A0A0C3KDP0_PISTI|nr:hypothetical protein BKA82DRAFT_393650 [Pisolithus tinctorius]KIO07727.1 hypothetical protein M404DRAFT_393650 [Pisolithus tinctorius Marx 270]
MKRCARAYLSDRFLLALISMDLMAQQSTLLLNKASILAGDLRVLPTSRGEADPPHIPGDGGYTQIGLNQIDTLWASKSCVRWSQVPRQVVQRTKCSCANLPRQMPPHLVVRYSLLSADGYVLVKINQADVSSLSSYVRAR